jgi:hypothetical protein
MEPVSYGFFNRSKGKRAFHMSLASMNEVSQRVHDAGCKEMHGDGPRNDEGARHFEKRGKALGHDGSVARRG